MQILKFVLPYWRYQNDSRVVAHSVSLLSECLTTCYTLWNQGMLTWSTGGSVLRRVFPPEGPKKATPESVFLAKLFYIHVR
jgi:hypothetical protein